MGTTSKRGYYYPGGNDEVSLFPDQHRVNAMSKIDTDMNTALTKTSVLEFRIAELESGPRVTGPRNINSLIDNEMHDSGNCFIERHNNIVVMYFSNLNLVGSGSTGLMTLPYGFKPNINPVQSFVSDKRTRFGYLDIYGSGRVWMGRFGDGIDHIATVSWVTDDDWPSTLPGNPA